MINERNILNECANNKNEFKLLFWNKIKEKKNEYIEKGIIKQNLNKEINDKDVNNDSNNLLQKIQVHINKNLLKEFNEQLFLDTLTINNKLKIFCSVNYKIVYSMKIKKKTKKNDIENIKKQGLNIHNIYEIKKKNISYFINEYLIIKNITDTVFGSIYLCKSIINKKFYCLKIFYVDLSFKKNCPYHLNNEVYLINYFNNILLEIFFINFLQDNHNIIKIHKILYDDKENIIFILLPYIKHQSLHFQKKYNIYSVDKYIKKVNNLVEIKLYSNQFIRFLFYKIYETLCYLLNKNVVYLDLKPDHIFLNYLPEKEIRKFIIKKKKKKKNYLLNNEHENEKENEKENEHEKEKEKEENEKEKEENENENKVFTEFETKLLQNFKKIKRKREQYEKNEYNIFFDNKKRQIKENYMNKLFINMEKKNRQNKYTNFIEKDKFCDFKKIRKKILNDKIQFLYNIKSKKCFLFDNNVKEIFFKKNKISNLFFSTINRSNIYIQIFIVKKKKKINNLNNKNNEKEIFYKIFNTQNYNKFNISNISKNTRINIINNISIFQTNQNHYINFLKLYWFYFNDNRKFNYSLFYLDFYFINKYFNKYTKIQLYYQNNKLEYYQKLYCNIKNELNNNIKKNQINEFIQINENEKENEIKNEKENENINENNFNKNILTLIDFDTCAFKINKYDSYNKGTDMFNSYECLFNNNDDKKINVFKKLSYNFGCVLYVFLFGKTPYGNSIFKMYEKMKKNKLKFPKYRKINKCLKNLLRKLLTNDVKKRIEFKNIKKHKWFLKMNKIN